MVDLAETVQRSDYSVLYGLAEDETENISLLLYLPEGIFDVLQLTLKLQPVGSEAVAIENHPGMMLWQTSGGVDVAAMNWDYGAHFVSNAFIHVFTPKVPFILSSGDRFNYRNTDLEASGTMDVTFNLVVRRLR